MVRCPKCGIKGDYYTPLVTFDTDFDGDRMYEINKVECDECGHQYIVKEVFKLSLENCYNVE